MEQLGQMTDPEPVKLDLCDELIRSVLAGKDATL